MSTARQRRGLQGVTPLRRKLRRMQEQVDAQIRPAIEEGSQAILADMKRLTPERTGELRQKMDYKVARDGLTAQIGVRTKTRARDVFYFAFLDSGTKGDAKRNIPPMEAMHIRARAFDTNKAGVLARVKAAVERVLTEAANG